MFVYIKGVPLLFHNILTVYFISKILGQLLYVANQFVILITIRYN